MDRRFCITESAIRPLSGNVKQETKQRGEGKGQGQPIQCLVRSLA